jgi:hypothetical protein
VPYANLTNPQTLNLYDMVSDNPETYADLDGHLLGNQGDPASPRAPRSFCSSSEDGSCDDAQAQAFNLGSGALCRLCDPAQSPGGSLSSTPAQNPSNQGGAASSGGTNSNYRLPDVDLLKIASDFSAGAGDCLTGRCLFLGTSLTELARQADGSDSVVNKGSTSYTVGTITGSVVGTALVSATGATAAAVADGKNGALFGRGTQTLFNSSKVRFGWGWEGSAKAGRDVIRLGIGAARGTSWWSHIPFFYP